MIIRPETPADVDGTRTVHTRAFGRPAEAVLVDRLRADASVAASLVAEDAGDVIGHILFSRVTIEGAPSLRAVALAPLAVIPERQRRGIGSALVLAGLEACGARGEQMVIVLGHADYYARFGFSAALAQKLRSPYSGPSFMAVELAAGALENVDGEVRYPAAFRSAGL